MRRSASEVINNLETRIANLEKRATIYRKATLDVDLEKNVVNELRREGFEDFDVHEVKECTLGGYCYLILDIEGAIVHDDGEQEIMFLGSVPSAQAEFNKITKGRSLL